MGTLVKFRASSRVRPVADRERIQRLMTAFGRTARTDVRVHLVGGATAVLIGWRGTTIDVDLVMRPEDDALLRAIPALKEDLRMNVELASPADFIPIPPGWEPDLYRFPAIDPPSFRRALEQAFL